MAWRFDSKGNVYAADQGVGAIFIFNPETKAVEIIKNGKDAHFNLIVGLAIDDNDRIFVSDDKLHHVAVISPKHQQETSVRHRCAGAPRRHCHRLHESPALCC